MFLSVINDLTHLLGEIDTSLILGVSVTALVTYILFNAAQVATILKLSENLPYSKLKKAFLSALVFIPMIGLYISLSVIAATKGRDALEKAKTKQSQSEASSLS